MEPHAGHAAGASARRERAVLGLPLLAPAVALRQRPVGVVRVLGHLHAWHSTPRVSKLVELVAGNPRVECANTSQKLETHEQIKFMDFDVH